MATNEQGILGGFSGKVGTVIGGNWNGVDFMRGIPARIANPRTAAQQDQRARMGTIVQFLSPLKAFLRVGFKKQAIKMSAFNAATSYNLAHAITGTYPDYGVDYSKVLISQGKLPGALNPQIISTTSGQIKFTWEDNSLNNGAMGNDRALLVVYNPEKGLVVTSFGDSIRAEGSQMITLPSKFEGTEVQCYIAFQNANQTVISDSRWAGGMVV
ncbi:MAG TPA: hypothetical protein DCL77_17975 [Prolixibacteraceae bacterium]|jgi:hypothetical protein|nr:hypothetical protein [Prolixibacteraceae bacterium]